jgi:hypothetical protein
MNTKTGRFQIVDSYYPSKSPSDIYRTQYEATLIAGRMNGQCGSPRRYVVKDIDNGSAHGLFSLNATGSL